MRKKLLGWIMLSIILTILVGIIIENEVVIIIPIAILAVTGLTITITQCIRLIMGKD